MDPKDVGAVADSQCIGNGGSVGAAGRIGGAGSPV